MPYSHVMSLVQTGFESVAPLLGSHFGRQLVV